jgi:hypothetical protein
VHGVSVGVTSLGLALLTAYLTLIPLGRFVLGNGCSNVTTAPTLVAATRGLASLDWRDRGLQLQARPRVAAIVLTLRQHPC